MTELIASTLMKHGIRREVREFELSTRTAADAARTLGCTEAEIGKSIIFRIPSNNSPLLVVASGANRVSESSIEGLLGFALVRASADFVYQSCGYAIGGVPPFGHSKPIQTVIDRDLLKFDRIYVAAGTPKSVVELSIPELCTLLPDALIASIT